MFNCSAVARDELIRVVNSCMAVKKRKLLPVCVGLAK